MPKLLQMVVLLAALLASVGSVGAGSSSDRDTLRPRAAFDLDCTQQQLHVTQLNDTTYGVRGCGRQATYVWSCHSVGSSGTECDWNLNGGPYNLAPAPPTPPPAPPAAPAARPPEANEPPSAPVAPGAP